MLLLQGVQFCWAFSNLFAFCYFGERVTSAFDDLSKVIYQCEWESFPHEIQRILPVIMLNTQDPIFLRAFDRTPCTRETFKRVKKKIPTKIRFSIIQLTHLFIFIFRLSEVHIPILIFFVVLFWGEIEY